MHVRRVFLFLIFVSAAFCWAQVGTDDSSRSLGDIARELRAKRQQDSSVKETTQTVVSEQDGGVKQTSQTAISELVAELSLNNEDDYKGHVRDMFARQDFAGLEHAADLARTRQSRFPGGVWKLWSFYEAVTVPSGGRHTAQEDWDTRLSLLKHWNDLYPRSTTARIALAQAYLEHGRKARGGGESDTVTEEGWQKLAINTRSAEETLGEAAALPDKCPFYYASMLEVALYSGWSKDRTRALMEEAMRFEPGFYHYYRLYANYLQPKWYGDPGEVEAFAREVADHLGGDEGNFVYFEIGSLLGCGACGTQSSFNNMSWPRIKEGYAALEHMYGTSNLKMNRFAYMTTETHDRTAAKEVFTQIGENWNRAQWKTRQEFETARDWALADPR